VCHVHGAAKGTPAREAADQAMLRDLIGPALLVSRDSALSPDTPHSVRLGAVKEILDRSGYDEDIPITIGMLEVEIARLEISLKPISVVSAP
jgi:hypothetical protein